VTHRVLVRAAAEDGFHPIEPDRLDDHLGNGSLVWLDVATRASSEMDELGERFGFDPAAIEDVIDVEQLPKYEVYDDHLFVVLHALTFSDDRVDTHEVDCFVRDDLLVTVRSTEVVGVDWLWDSVQSFPHLAGSGARELFAQLAEVVGRRYLEILDEVELRVDELSDRALAADQRVLGEIQLLRREEATIRRALRPQRLVVSNLRANTRGLFDEGALRILGDAYDVHNLVVETLSATRGLLTDTLDTYRGASSEREASATMILTVYAAILLPLSLITSWYGMNMTDLPGTGHPWGWLAVTVAMVAVAAVSWVWFIRVGIIRAPRARRVTLVRSLGVAARAPVKPFTMLRRPVVPASSSSSSSSSSSTTTSTTTRTAPPGGQAREVGDGRRNRTGPGDEPGAGG
jgi:magnesium transporter